MSETILDEANRIAGECRSRDYGHPLINHERIAAFWNIQLAAKLREPIEPREVALLMIGLKLAREVNTPKRDNLVDMAGYIKCVDMIDQAQSVRLGHEEIQSDPVTATQATPASVPGVASTR